MKDNKIEHEMWFVSPAMFPDTVKRETLSAMDLFLDGALIRTKSHMAFSPPSDGPLPFHHRVFIERHNGSTETYRGRSFDPMKLEDWGFVADAFEEVKRPHGEEETLEMFNKWRSAKK